MTISGSVTTFPIVGVGASAGGLRAFSELLSQVSADSGMAFVLVQHLSPDQESLLSELLGRTTSMPVIDAEDGMVVEANQVYVIPPGVQMAIAQGTLQITSCDQSLGRTKTIDLFFQSLAADQKNQAIAVVLSGSNNDGAQGIREVRAAGGITFAQEGATAEFAEMPNAAVATGQVDFVLSPTQIAEELVSISQHPYLCDPTPHSEDGDRPDDSDASVFQDDDLRKVYQLLQKHTGVDFTQYKKTTFERRLRRRITVNKRLRLSEYLEYLQATPAEVQALYQDVLITVTSFFRDAEIYVTLQESIFPALLQQQSAASSIRIWVPGCATGEEAYSLAMCLLESLDAYSINPKIQIFGTDISDRAIETARAGVYRESQMEGVSLERRHRFFMEVEDGYQISPVVRELCIFARQDLSSEPPFSDLDLVTCRNVLIYFKAALQRRVMSIFHYGLKPNGFLMLGNSESLGDTSELFEVFNAKARIYRRKDVPIRLDLDFVATYHPQELKAREPSSIASTLSHSSVQQWAAQLLLNRYAPVGVIINEAMEILHFQGEPAPYLRLTTGEPSFNLLKLLRPSLLTHVRPALEQAKQQKIAVKQHNLQIDDMQADSVSIEVIPFVLSQGRYFFVLFEQSPDSEPAAANPAAVFSTTESKQVNAENSRLRQELLDTQTFLQITVEEQKATQQQLIAANEEILSSNEELKSTNEELQTAKEEIQSANEELKTTNEELQHINTEWHQANNDLVNLLNNVNIPILMLSDDLCIRSLTPAARTLLHLMPSDVGRSIQDFNLRINIPHLESLVLEVVETLNAVEREVQDQSGRWYLLRIRPYRTLDNQINGVVIALIDVNNLKWVEQELRLSQNQLQQELLAMSRVQTLSMQLFSSLDLSQALDEVLSATLIIHGAEKGNVLLYDPDEGGLTLAAQHGFAPDVLDDLVKIWNEAGATLGQALINGEQIYIEDVQADPVFEMFRPMAARGSFRAVHLMPLVSRSGDWLGTIATYFQQPHKPSMRVAQLLDLYGRQASEFINLVRTERDRLSLQEQERVARQANASKDRFLSVLSHELRTPLNSILGWTYLIERGLPDASLWDEAIAAIKAGTLNQLKLVEDLLDASRIIQERFEINVTPTDVRDILREAIALIHPQAIAKNIQIEADLEPSSDLLLLDSARIEQVVVNLLSNAVKFTPQGGHVTVCLTYSETQVQVQISDTGQGIEPSLLPHVFDRFRQADSSDTRRESGLGLGLF
ncbi:MAG: chemotaxis protein CheB, partial [Elainellaceae cyanobacterium]